MNDIDILKFKETIADFNVDQLMDMRNQLNESISQMLFNYDSVIKVALIEALIKEKLDKETHNG